MQTKDKILMNFSLIGGEEKIWGWVAISNLNQSIWAQGDRPKAAAQISYRSKGAKSMCESSQQLQQTGSQTVGLVGVANRQQLLLSGINSKRTSMN